MTRNTNPLARMNQYELEAQVEADFREAQEAVPHDSLYEGITPVPLDEESLLIRSEMRRELLTDSPDLDA